LLITNARCTGLIPHRANVLFADITKKSTMKGEDRHPQGAAVGIIVSIDHLHQLRWWPLLGFPTPSPRGPTIDIFVNFGGGRCRGSRHRLLGGPPSTSSSTSVVAVAGAPSSLGACVIPHSEKAKTKPPYVCPGCSNRTYISNMTNRCHVQ
jgi:hypothetical protein